MSRSSEVKQIKEEKGYNDTGKSRVKLESKEKICGVAAIPGKEFRSKIVFAYCTSCNLNVPTEVDSTWNLKSYLCCYYYGACWKCWALIKGHDWTAKNGVHKCSACKAELANYQAC